MRAKPDGCQPSVSESSPNVNVRPSEAATVAASFAGRDSRPSRSRIPARTRSGNPPSRTSARPSTTRIRSSSLSPSNVSTSRNGLPAAWSTRSRTRSSGSPPRSRAASSAAAASSRGASVITAAPFRLSCSIALAVSGADSGDGRQATSQAIAEPASARVRDRRAAAVPASAHCASSMTITSGRDAAARSSRSCRSRSSQKRWPVSARIDGRALPSRSGSGPSNSAPSSAASSTARSPGSAIDTPKRIPRRFASRTPSRRSRLLPIPLAPSTTMTPPEPGGDRSSSPPISRNSDSRPSIPACRAEGEFAPTRLDVGHLVALGHLGRHSTGQAYGGRTAGPKEWRVRAMRGARPSDQTRRTLL